MELLDLIAFAAVVRSRFTLSRDGESFLVKFCWICIILSPMIEASYCKISSWSEDLSDFHAAVSCSDKEAHTVKYEHISVLHAISYVLPWLLLRLSMLLAVEKNKILPIVNKSNLFLNNKMAIFSCICTTILIAVMNVSMTRDAIFRLLSYMFPIEELKAAYSIISIFLNHESIDSVTEEWVPVMDNTEVLRLLIITANLQVATGYVGIKYVEECQRRKNALVYIKPPDKASKNEVDGAQKQTKNFRFKVLSFIFLTAIPYLIERTAADNINYYAFSLVKNKMHANVRLNALFEHDSQLFAMTESLKFSPGSE